MSIFYEVLKEHEALVQAALSDIIAYRERVHALFLLAGVPCKRVTAGVVERCRDKIGGIWAHTCVWRDRIQHVTSTRQRCCTTRASTLSRCAVYAPCHSSVPMLLSATRVTHLPSYSGRSVSVLVCVIKQRSVSGKAQRVTAHCNAVECVRRCIASRTSSGFVAKKSWRVRCRAASGLLSCHLFLFCAKPSSAVRIALYAIGLRLARFTSCASAYGRLARAQRSFCCGHPPSSHARQGPFAGPCDGRCHRCAVPTACCQWAHNVSYYGHADVQSRCAVSPDFDEFPVVIFDTKEVLFQ